MKYEVQSGKNSELNDSNPERSRRVNVQKVENGIVHLNVLATQKLCNSNTHTLKNKGKNKEKRIQMAQQKKECNVMKGIVLGNEEVMKAFYKKNFPIVKKYVLKNSGSVQDAEDVLQDAMLVLYQKLREDTVDIHCSIYTYFFGICRNIWKARLRINNRWVLNNELIEYQQNIETPMPEVLHPPTQEQIYKKYFGELNSMSRKLLHLFFEGKSMREIAGLMGYTERYTRKKKSLLVKCLRSNIQKDPLYELITSND